jgi:SAM-dependent methyltransferase
VGGRLAEAPTLAGMPRLRDLAARLPAPAKSAVQAALGPADPLLVRRYRRRTGTADPIPPLALRARVGAPAVETFIRSARGINDLLERALEPVGRTPADFARVLDLGCGCGRSLVPLAQRWPGPEYHGCDIDEPAVAWLRRHHPRLRVTVNAFDPPLPYAAGSFDLVYAISLFTHLDERAQDAWLAEVRRVLGPDGLGVLTIHGAQAFASFSSGAITGAIPAERIAAHEPFRPGSFVYEEVRATRWNAVRFIPGGKGWGLAFHGDEYVRERWGRVFDSVRVVPGGGLQDAVVVA